MVNPSCGPSTLYPVLVQSAAAAGSLGGLSVYLKDSPELSEARISPDVSYVEAGCSSYDLSYYGWIHRLQNRGVPQMGEDRDDPARTWPFWEVRDLPLDLDRVVSR